MNQPIPQPVALHQGESMQEALQREQHHTYVINVVYYRAQRETDYFAQDKAEIETSYVMSIGLEQSPSTMVDARVLEHHWGGVFVNMFTHYISVKEAIDKQRLNAEELALAPTRFISFLLTPQYRVPVVGPVVPSRKIPDIIIEGLHSLDFDSVGFMRQQDEYNRLTNLPHRQDVTTTPIPSGFQTTTLIVMEMKRFNTSKFDLFEQLDGSAKLALKDRPMRGPSQKSCFCIGQSGMHLFLFEYYRDDHPGYGNITHNYNYVGDNGLLLFPGLVPIFPRGYDRGSRMRFFAVGEESMVYGFHLHYHSEFIHKVMLYMFLKQTPDASALRVDLLGETYIYL